MLKSSLYDYNDVYILVKGTIAVPNTGEASFPTNANKKVIFKDCNLFTDCISRINSTQADVAHDIDEVMPMC